MSASGRATDLASNWHEARNLDFTRHYLQGLQRIGPYDVQQAATELTERGLNLTVLDPLDAPVATRTRKAARQREEIQSHTLSNGIEVALMPDHRVPLVQLQLAARAGLPSETEATQGISRLLAATLPKGTESRSAEQIARELESLGASIGAASGNNALLLHVSGLAEDLPTIAEVLADVAIAPRFDELAIKREKSSQLAALEEARQEPLHVGMQGLKSACYQGVGYGLESLGSHESLKQLHRPALLDHHRRHLVGANLSLTVAGDFQADTLLEELEARFAALPTGERWQPERQHFKAGQDITLHLPKKQAVLAIGFEGASASGDERHALAFLQEYASDMAGPLFGRIREQLGLAYRVGATQFVGYDSGMLSFYVATSPEQAGQARDEMLREIAKMAEHGIPLEAFERVRSTALSGLAIQQQSLAAIARAAALDLLFGHPADAHRQLESVYSKLKPEAVKKVAQRVLSAEPVVVTVLPEQL
jgi:zinc protease